MKKTMTARPIMMPISTGIWLRKCDMDGPFGLSGDGDFDGIGADDAHDDNLGAGRKLLAGGNGLVLDGAIELAHVNFADAGPGGGDGQVDGARSAQGAFNTDGAVHIEVGQKPH